MCFTEAPPFVGSCYNASHQVLGSPMIKFWGGGTPERKRGFSCAHTILADPI